MSISIIQQLGREAFTWYMLRDNEHVIIEKLNEFFFEDKKYNPNINDYYNPINNYLNIVLEKKTGIPITLSLIYIHLASYMDFKLHPINFPSHFLVKYVLDDDSDESIVIDPFNKGRIADF